MTEGKEKAVRESEEKKGEEGSASEARSIRQSLDPIKEKAHLKQQALWGIARSSAPLSHQAQSEHENLQHMQTKHHTAAIIGCRCGARGPSFFISKHLPHPKKGN